MDSAAATLAETLVRMHLHPVTPSFWEEGRLLLGSRLPFSGVALRQGMVRGSMVRNV